MEERFRIKERLQVARSEAGISQAELSRRVAARGAKSLTGVRISYLELGYRDATNEEAAQIARALDVSPEWLLGASDSKERAGAPQARPTTAARSELPSSPKPVAPAQVQFVSSPPVTPQVNATIERPPDPLDPPTTIPQRNGGSASEYRRQLAAKMQRTNERLGDRALTPAQWRGGPI